MVQGIQNSQINSTSFPSTNEIEQMELAEKIAVLKAVNPNDPGIKTLQAMLNELNANPLATLTSQQLETARNIQ